MASVPWTSQVGHGMTLSVHYSSSQFVLQRACKPIADFPTVPLAHPSQDSFLPRPALLQHVLLSPLYRGFLAPLSLCQKIPLASPIPHPKLFLSLRCPHAGFNSKQRSLHLLQQELVLRRVLGNVLHQPHDSLPGMVGGHTSGVLIAGALNPAARLRLIDSLPAERRSSLNERSTSSDSVEGVYADLHGQLGYRPDPQTLLGRAANLDWRARVRAMPAEQRGSTLPAASRVYTCREDESAGSAAAWNDSRVHFDQEAGQRWEANWAKRLGRKAAGTGFLATCEVDKSMR